MAQIIASFRALAFTKMMHLLLMLTGFSLLFSSCLNLGSDARQVAVQAPPEPMQTARFELLDSSRQRVIPIVAYFPATASPSPAAGAPAPKLKLALLNHGYGVSNAAYSFVAQNLVAHGYYVVSLQHDLPTDVPIPQTGNIQQTRYPYWKRGGENIAFTIRAMQRRNLSLDTQQVLLLGHSYGGDIAMLFAGQHPAMVRQVISFDNCRVPLPRTRQPKIFSLRSSDQVADPGVLPSPAEQAESGITIIQLPATRHNQMQDGATARQKQEINGWISHFLEMP